MRREIHASDKAALAAGGLCAATVFVPLLLKAGERFCLDASAWAGWAQAIGTVLAIGFAVWLGQRQMVLQRQMQREQEASRVDARAALVRAVAHFARAVASTFPAYVEGQRVTIDGEIPRPREATFRGLQDVVELLKEHRPESWSCGAEVSLWAMSIGHVDELVDRLERQLGHSALLDPRILPAINEQYTAAEQLSHIAWAIRNDCLNTVPDQFAFMH